ncbi:hypothetical protein A1O7_08971 [Cladophialophora yegresii CBS 114405]|uniref:Major facilitator superfamily (MFS) profile domain-containing protein n=1 Tax=Cladophialophora yegresii CBS 114405 TaxID=1182544 RepID=W9VSQ1_9EURO|nr:uncharacterized protein A1O7_08971 [Cladophialophora yegresii CBS 114405]EXJ56040.1 hypothetical protein A1O7_08971 [Cladophialophora yegresii CBS 114405]
MNRYQFLCLAYVTFGSIFYGYDSGITTSILAYERFLIYFDLNATKIGAFNSAYYGGSFIGCMLNWYLPNKIGRLRTIQLSCAVAFVGISMQTAAKSFGVFCAGRVVGGIACGLVFSVCPTYASEISPPEIRGFVGGVYAVNINFAYMFTEWIGLGLYFIDSDVSWRLLLGLQLVPAVAMFAGSFWMPFSPRWLILKDRNEEALVVLKKMHSAPGHEDFPLREYHQIRAQIELDRSERLGVSSILSKKSYRKRLMIVVGAALFQQLTGVIPIQNYQVQVYQSLGFSNILSLVLTGIYGTVATASAVLAMLLCDRIGRRKLVFVAYGLMIPASLVLVILWSRFEASGNTNRGLGIGVVFAIYLFSCGYSGPMNTFWPTYSAEILPTSIRSFGVANSYLTFNGIVILLVQCTPLALEAISWRYFIVFLVMDFIFVVAFSIYCPETRMKTLEEIEALFGDHVAETPDGTGKHLTDEELKEPDVVVTENTNATEQSAEKNATSA